MSYMNYPRCGLSVELRGDRMAWESCPHCLGCCGISVPIRLSSRRRWPPAASQKASPADGQAVSVDEPADLVPLSIDSKPGADGWVLALRGELDLVSASALREQLHALEQAGVDRLVLDLRELSFIDSSGLGVLVAADLRARLTDGQVQIIDNHGQVKRSLSSPGSTPRPATPAH